MKSNFQFRLHFRFRFWAMLAGFLVSNVCTVLSIAAVTLIFPRVMSSVEKGITADSLTVFVSVEALVFGLGYSVLGGAVLARLARDLVTASVYLNSILAGIVQLLIFYPYDSTAPIWYRVSLLFLTLPAYGLGARVGLLLSKRRELQTALV